MQPTQPSRTQSAPEATSVESIATQVTHSKAKSYSVDEQDLRQFGASQGLGQDEVDSILKTIKGQNNCQAFALLHNGLAGGNSTIHSLTDAKMTAGHNIEEEFKYIARLKSGNLPPHCP